MVNGNGNTGATRPENANANAGGNAGATRPETENKNANANAGGNPNINKNLNQLIVNAGANKETFAKAFEAAADYASGFDEISKKCGVLAITIRKNANIDLNTKFGSYGSNKINETSLKKVKEFTGNKSNNAPTRAAILVKILKEIKDLVKKRRNNNRKAAANINTAKNFNMAIVNLIKAVNEAKGNTPANNSKTNEKTPTPTPGNE